MAKRDVKWTRTADLQFAGILEYWVKHNRSVDYSLKLVETVSKTTEQISETPYIHKVTDFPNTRAATLGNFSIIYKVADNEIIITAFWDNRQDPEKLLEILSRQDG